MRFTIRDLLWLTVVALLVVAWLVQIRESQRLGREAYDTRRAIRSAGYELDGGKLVPRPGPSSNPSAPATETPKI